MVVTTGRPTMPARMAKQVGPRMPTQAANVMFGPIPNSQGQRIVIYGPGGIGKTTLACTAPGPVAMGDLDGSLPILKPKLVGLDVRVVSGLETWNNLRDAINAPGWDAIKTLVIDTITRAEELAGACTLATVPHEKGGLITRIEDYGYGKGYTHIYETFLPLLADLDRHCQAGRNVILVCHECTAPVPNPMGEDYIRYEPRLQSPTSGKASIRLRVREWADHLLFIGYDIDVKKAAKDRAGKAKGSGTRTIYPCELPHCMAKSRILSNAFTLSDPWANPQAAGGYDTAVWDALFGAPDGDKPTEQEA